MNLEYGMMPNFYIVKKSLKAYLPKKTDVFHVRFDINPFYTFVAIFHGHSFSGTF